MTDYRSDLVDVSVVLVHQTERAALEWLETA